MKIKTSYEKRTKIKKVLITVFCILILFIANVIGVLNPLNICFNENQILYFSSTVAQVSATLFGLIITGYVFVDAKLKQDISNDDSLVEINEKIRSMFIKNLILIGIMDVIVVVAAITNILLEKYLLELNHLYINVLLYNGAILFVIEIILIFIFVYKMIDPTKVTRISNIGKLKMESSKSTLLKKYDNLKPKNLLKENKNYFIEFVETYNKIEKLILNYKNNKYNYLNQKFIEKLKMLANDFIIDRNIYLEVENLRRYRNYIVHSSEPFVKKYQYEWSRKLLAILYKILD